MRKSYPVERSIEKVWRSADFGHLDFENRTTLDDGRLERLLLEAIVEWPIGRASVRVRPSRGADFSGSCLYRHERIYVNLGDHLRYPYQLNTYLARAISSRRSWHKPLYHLEIADGYQLVLFVFLHEWYHLLVKRARRNTRQKESMCDRFAARYLVDRFGLEVHDPQGRTVPRGQWDFQDLRRFVSRAAEIQRTRSTQVIALPPAPKEEFKPKLSIATRKISQFPTQLLLF